ncbi:hypothetical protein pb186bvf_001871 [Paramecium bursaria]
MLLQCVVASHENHPIPHYFIVPQGTRLILFYVSIYLFISKNICLKKLLSYVQTLFYVIQSVQTSDININMIKFNIDYQQFKDQMNQEDN